MKTLSMLLFAAAMGAMPVLADSGKIQTPLVPVEGSAVTGSVEAGFSATKSSLEVNLKGLSGGTTYNLLIDGTVRASLVASAKGTAKLEWLAPSKPGKRFLDFDPRGKTIALNAGEIAVLSGVVSSQGEDRGSRVSESADLRPLVALPKAKATSSFVVKDGVSTWTVTARGLPAGDVTLLLDGATVITTTPIKGAINLRFSSRPASGVLPLPRDPRGASIDLLQNGVTIFQGTVNSRGQGANIGKKAEYFLLIPATDASIVGEVKAKFKSKDDGRRDFSVEIEDATLGTYELYVNEVLEGSIVVATTDNGTEGEIEFSNSEDDGSKELLDFNPEGAKLSVRLTGVVQFEGIFSAAAVTNKKPSSQEDRSEKLENLTSTGLTPAAEGKAEYEVDSNGRHRFKVEIEKLPVGRYLLLVGGVQKAVINVVEGATNNKGEVEFRSVSEAGKILLNFDPRGQLLEVVNPMGQLEFSHLFGDGSAAGGSGGSGGGTLPPGSDFDFALFAQGGQSGSANVRYRYDSANDADFRVKLKSVAVGSYTIKVDGAVVGTVQAVVSGSQAEGELEFDTSPSASQSLLNFAVNGKLIEILSGSTVIFSRTAP